MGKPAARTLDMHVCPAFTALVPHVGGPLLPLGAVPTVLIGGSFAATVGTMCTCAGPPAAIMMGSPTVLIGGKMAARMGDTTAHGGTIVLGCATVLIGESGSGSASGAGKQVKKKLLKGLGAKMAADMENSDALKKAAKDGDANANKTTKDDFSAKYALKDVAGKPKANIGYTITKPDGEKVTGNTNNNGETEQLQGFTVADCKVSFNNK
jgi:uncharacterized Zn-binding protein involved in type VI secretion